MDKSRPLVLASRVGAKAHLKLRAHAISKNEHEEQNVGTRLCLDGGSSWRLCAACCAVAVLETGRQQPTARGWEHLRNCRMGPCEPLTAAARQTQPSAIAPP
eukprot:6184640-Pleurochrysis_carterae.AAC.2